MRIKHYRATRCNEIFDSGTLVLEKDNTGEFWTAYGDMVSLELILQHPEWFEPYYEEEKP